MGSRLIDGTQGQEAFGSFFIDYATNPPRAESGIYPSPFVVTSTIRRSECGVADPPVTVEISESGDFGFYFNDDPKDCCDGGDTQIRIESGQFVIHGFAQDSSAGYGCAPGPLACTDNHRVPNSLHDRVEWRARPFCRPIAEEKLFDSSGNPNPAAADDLWDLDGDAIPDCWELGRGIEIQKTDGSPLISYPLPGADPAHKNLYIEVDYMAGFKPAANTLRKVSDAFARAPLTVENPDGTLGINLDSRLDEEVPYIPGILFKPGHRGNGENDDFWDIKHHLASRTSPCSSGFFGTVAERDDADCVLKLAVKQLIFRYVIFADTYADPVDGLTSSSGRSEIGGNDFIVTIGSLWRDTPEALRYLLLAGGQEEAEAATFMHELGHTLGLHHGGSAGDDLNCKPNYLSVMNYSLQFPNNDGNRPLDYSRGRLPDLDENNLNEEEGVGAPQGGGASGTPRNTVWGIGGLGKRAPAFGAIDWNDNGPKTDTGIGQVLHWNDGVPSCSRPNLTVDGAFLKIPFTSELSASTPPAGAFSVATGIFGSGPQNVSAISVDTRRYAVYVTLGRSVDPAAEVSVTYTKPASGPGLASATGVPVSSFGPLRVDNIGGSRQVLHGFDDWASLQYRFRGSPSFADGAGPFDDSERELTNDDIGAMAELVVRTRTADSDGTSPTTVATTTPAANANGWNSVPVTVDLVATDEVGGSGVKEIAFNADGANPIASSIATGPVSLSIEAEGETTLSYSARDNAGNAETLRLITIRIDRTAPSVTGTRRTPANPDGWNNGPVVVHFEATDVLAGIDGPSMSDSVVSSEGAGQLVTSTFRDLAGNLGSANVGAINIDLTAPVTSTRLGSAPSAAGWWRSAVAVTLSSVDNLSGIARAEYSLDGVSWRTYSDPIVVTTQGIHTLHYRSIDRAENAEVSRTLTIPIDLRAPEAILRFDPATKDVVAFGRDDLAGFDPDSALIATNAIVPERVERTAASDNAVGIDSDLRTYRVTDRAGNMLVLTVRLRRAGNQLKAEVVSASYNETTPIAAPLNRLSVEWSAASNGTIKELEQQIDIGVGDARQQAKAKFAAREDQSTVTYTKGDRKVVSPGIVLLQLVTDAGKLVIE